MVETGGGKDPMVYGRKSYDVPIAIGIFVAITVLSLGVYVVARSYLG